MGKNSKQKRFKQKISALKKENHTLYRFEIEDTGIGMEASFLDHIWEPYLQENNRNYSEQKGTGLGMSITKKLVDLMDGIITVESKLGVGSRFIVDIAFDIDLNTPNVKPACMA